jgi:hypothetical protein
MNGLLANAIEAHGGLERWKQFTAIEVDLVSGGELLERKSVRSSGTVHFAAKMHEQINSFVATSAPDKKMVFCADRIAVETIEGKLIAERLDPRQSFHGHDLNTPWDPFHRGYFSGYAMWNYLTSPFSLAVEGAQVWDIEPLEKNGELWRGIRAVLPKRFATHSRAQEFYFGDDMLLRRQDYTLDIAGGFKVANYASEFVDVKGLKLPSKRRAFLCNKKYDEQSEYPLVRLDMSNFRVA